MCEIELSKEQFLYVLKSGISLSHHGEKLHGRSIFEFDEKEYELYFYDGKNLT